MRITSALRSAVPLAFLLAVGAAPSAANAAPPVPAAAAEASAAGLYNVLVRGNVADQRVSIMLVKSDSGYTGTLITADQEVLLQNVRVDGATIHAIVPTNFGRAKLELRTSDSAVIGTLKLAKVTLSIGGQRMY